MTDINQVVITGRLGRDPETRQVSDTSVTPLSVAVARSRKDAEGKWVEETDWVNVVVWAKDRLLAGLKKGDRVAVAGRLHARKYQAKDGTDRHVTEIVAEHVMGIRGAEKKEEAPF